ncbi:MAG: hypothetical protein ACLGHN_14205 [Bacteriovoracia bacterium]
MKNILKITLSLMTLSLMLTGISFAGDEKQEAQEKQKAATSKEAMNLKQVEGTIVEHKMVNVFKDEKAKQQAEKQGKAEEQVMVVLLKTEKGNDRLVVDLGQVKDLPEIKDGESKLQVEGKLISVGTKQLFVAKRAKLNGKMIEIKRQSA